MRVETRIGYFVVKAWVTEGIRPGVVACSHHMGRWKLDGPRPAPDDGDRDACDHEGTRWDLRRERGVEPFDSADPDTSRIWWTDVGVHQNLTFPVQPDPISGMHCWHQAVRVRRAEPGDRPGDISVDTAKSRAAYREWLARTRPAVAHSPDGTRRPYWLLRPLKPGPRRLQAAGDAGQAVSFRPAATEPTGVLLRALARRPAAAARRGSCCASPPPRRRGSSGREPTWCRAWRSRRRSARALIPAVGGLVAGLVLALGSRWAGGARGWDILEAVVLRNGVLPLRSALVRARPRS